MLLGSQIILQIKNYCIVTNIEPNSQVLFYQVLRSYFRLCSKFCLETNYFVLCYQVLRLDSSQNFIQRAIICFYVITLLNQTQDYDKKCCLVTHIDTNYLVFCYYALRSYLRLCLKSLVTNRKTNSLVLCYLVLISDFRICSKMLHSDQPQDNFVTSHAQ